MHTIVNLSWHAMEVSIQETTVAVRRGITAAALGSQTIEPGCLCPASRASHRNERQMLGGESSRDPEA